MDESDRLLSVDELADYLGTIYAWRHRRGGLSGFGGVGRQLRHRWWLVCP